MSQASGPAKICSQVCLYPQPSILSQSLAAVDSDPVLLRSGHRAPALLLSSGGQQQRETIDGRALGTWARRNNGTSVCLVPGRRRQCQWRCRGGLGRGQAEVSEEALVQDLSLGLDALRWHQKVLVSRIGLVPQKETDLRHQAHLC